MGKIPVGLAITLFISGCQVSAQSGSVDERSRVQVEMQLPAPDGLAARLEEEIEATSYCDALSTNRELYEQAGSEAEREQSRVYDERLRPLAEAIEGCVLAEPLL